MKKKLKFVIPFLLIFLLVPTLFSATGIADSETQGSEQSWGISIGDKKEFTAGWTLDLDLPDNAWDMFEDFTLAVGYPANMTDIQGHYLNFSKIAEWPVETGNIGGEISDNTFIINLILGYKL